MITLRDTVFGALIVAALPAAAAAAPPTISPGGVVAWESHGADECVMAGKSWSPMEGVCWYAIDLDVPAGSLQVGRKLGGRWEERAVTVSAYPYDVQRITLQDDSKVDLSTEDLQRVRAESARIRRLWSLETPARFDLPLAAPLERMPTGGRFGSRRYFNDQPRSPHSGSDFGVPRGTPVLAVEAGRVELSDDFFFSGRSVFLDHGGGLISMYFHFTDLEVEQGAEVERGQRIGTVGATGRATGPHLHFGIRWHGARVDPGLLLGPVEEIPRITRSAAEVP